MDREISKQERLKKVRKTILRTLVVLVPVIAAILLLPRWLERPLILEDISIGEVDRGPIEISVSATGKLMPLMEEIVLSPINSRVQEVYKNPGDTVKAGEALLKLDLTSVDNDYQKLLDQRNMMLSEFGQSKVAADIALADLEIQRQSKLMSLSQLKSDLDSEVYLDSLGGSTAEKVRRAELNYEDAKLQMQQLERKVENQLKTADADLRMQKLKLSIFDRTLNEEKRKLRNAQVFSPKSAILTFVLNEIGAQVSPGTRLAVVSDLSRYKVDCSIADGHREKVVPGAKAFVEIGTHVFEGVITTVTPSVTNGIINFTVLLDESSHKSLRSGLSAMVNVIYGIHDEVVRIPNGKFYTYGEGNYELWVIEGKKAVKRRVRLRDSSFEYIEVVEGLSPGEMVILDELEKYKNKTEIKLKLKQPNHGNH